MTMVNVIDVSLIKKGISYQKAPPQTGKKLKLTENS